MIAVVGPEDSVALVAEVAEELGRRHELLVREYDDPREALAILQGLRGFCDVVLFTGQVPYAIARASDLSEDGPALQYVPHSGADLYRAIAQILRETGGAFPLVSVDALSRDTVARVFRDLDLPVPTVFEVTDLDGSLTYTSSNDWADAHGAALLTGNAQVALTCLASTHDALKQRGLQVRRITHTRVTVAEALERAFLTAELTHAKAGQVAIVLVQLCTVPTSGHLALTPTRRRELLQAQHLLSEVADQLRAQLSQEDACRYLLTSTLGIVEEHLLQGASGRARLATLLAAGQNVRVGIGIGVSVAAALEGAEAALHATATAMPAVVLRPDGRLIDAADYVGSSPTRSPIRDAAAVRLAARLGVGTQSLRQLLQAIRILDTEAVTARQLAEAYGVQPRSARRLLHALAAAGYAHEVDRLQSQRTGRPPTVFAVDLSALVQALGPDAKI